MHTFATFTPQERLSRHLGRMYILCGCPVVSVPTTIPLATSVLASSGKFQEDIQPGSHSFSRARVSEPERYLCGWHQDRGQCQSLHFCMGQDYQDLTQPYRKTAQRSLALC